MRLWLPLLLFVARIAAAATPVIDLPAGDTLRFIVTGDAGSTHSQLRDGLVAVATRMHIDAILLVGDNFYPCGVSGVADPQWTKITQHFGPTHLPIYPILGNHDYGDPQERPGLDHYVMCGHPDPEAELAETGRIPEWHFPARNYVLRSPLADIVMTDTEPVALAFPAPLAGSLDAAQERAWIADAVEHAHARWRIVVGHHTIYSSGMHGRKNDATQQRVRDELLPLYREHGVDLYICGHDHDMELIGDLQRRAGEPLFLISGAGSGLDPLRARKASDEPPTIYPKMPAQSYLGFAVLEIERGRMSISFYDAKGARTAGPFVLAKK